MTLISSKFFTMKSAAALDCIDDAHIACFGRLAAGHFARPQANATVLLEGLRKYGTTGPAIVKIVISR